MPQMGPLSWFSLMSIVVFLFVFMFCMLYYMQTPNPVMKKKEEDTLANWKW